MQKRKEKKKKERKGWPLRAPRRLAEGGSWGPWL